LHNATGGEIDVWSEDARIHARVVNDAGATLDVERPGVGVDRLRSNGTVRVGPSSALHAGVLENLSGQTLRGGTFVLLGDLVADGAAVQVNGSSLSLAGGTIRDA